MKGRTGAGWALLAAVVLAGCGWPMRGYDPAGTGHNMLERTIGTANVGELGRLWSGAFGPGGAAGSSAPAIANGSVFVGASDDKLYAFDDRGNDGCSGTPRTCVPLWTALTGGDVSSSPAVVDNVVYVGSDDGLLYAFDANGSIGCTGAPKVCAPLWTGATAGAVSSPVVANGIVYVVGGSALFAFDAAGTTGCGGVPKTCAPLWRSVQATSLRGSPVVAAGVVYAGGSGTRLYAFDAAGTAGCSGTPRTCAPRWTGHAPCGGIVTCVFTTPAVARGVVYVGSIEGDEFDHSGSLHAFDARGVTGCSGTPKVCTPLWTAGTYAVISSPTVANGVVYVTDEFYRLDDQTFETTLLGRLRAFDAAGNVGCGGTPKVCTSLWESDIGAARASPAVANGVVYAVSQGNTLGFNVFAFDASGTIECSGAPKTCQPLWLDQTGAAVASPAVASGVLYVATTNIRLHAWTVPG